MRTLGRALSPSEIIPHLRSLLKKVQASGEVPDFQKFSYPYTRRCLKVGVCVSGGPDSMALAYLLKNMPNAENIALDPLAFIVDHRARDGSTEEAMKVYGFLQDVGIPARVLTMKWPEGVKPLSLNNFESQARYQRYRLIARSAIQEGIDHLFLGHHQDDQVETLLMRLIRSGEPGLVGLRGIASESSIPCCDDIYGAHESSAISRSKLSSSQNVEEEQPDKSITIDSDLVTASAPGGILLHRPLLAFPKIDLVATCQKYNIQFVVDPTNKDPQSNSRNAVRYMRNNYSLPSALSARRILGLQFHAQDSQHQIEVQGAKQLKRFLIRRLDLKTSTVEVTVPALPKNDFGVLKGAAEAALILVDLVSPSARGDRPLRIPQRIVNALFSNDTLTTSSALTFRGVAITPHLTKSRTWILSRQPMRKSECLTNQWNFAPTHRECQYTDWTQWRLWDNRYWIRLSAYNAMLNKVEVAPFALYADRLSTRTKDELELLKESLARTAPGKIRLTLPVLVYQGHVIGLPTLGIKFSQTRFGPGVHIDWEVRYKAVKHLDNLQAIQSD